jgi:hypothetical protein
MWSKEDLQRVVVEFRLVSYPSCFSFVPQPLVFGFLPKFTDMSRKSSIEWFQERKWCKLEGLF